jgi:hypothetical protein
VSQLTAADFPELATIDGHYGTSLAGSTPLWYYALKEAQAMKDGLTIGPVGGRIVGEVLIGLLQSDPNSYVVAKPKWKPTLGGAGAAFRMTDFLRFAGVDPASRGQ